MSLTDDIAASIERQRGIDGVVETLARMPGNELQSLLMAVMRARAGRRSAADLVRQRNRDRTVSAEHGSLADIVELEHRALRADGFEPVILSPLAPLGINKVLGGVDTNQGVTTIRQSEAVADPTTSLALEAVMRRQQGQETVALSSSIRVMRLGPLPDRPDVLRHFTLFALASAGRVAPDERFETDALASQLRACLRMLIDLPIAGELEVDVPVSGRIVESQHGLDKLRVRVLDPLANEFPVMRWRVDAERTHARNYYDSLLFKIVVRHEGAEWMEIGDGGTTDWTQRMLDNRKERLLVSGISLDRLALLTVR